MFSAILDAINRVTSPENGVELILSWDHAILFEQVRRRFYPIILLNNSIEQLWRMLSSCIQFYNLQEDGQNWKLTCYSLTWNYVINFNYCGGSLKDRSFRVFKDFTSVTELFIDFLRFFDGELKIANMWFLIQFYDIPTLIF